VPDPRILFLSLTRTPPSQEISAAWLRRRNREIPGPEGAFEVMGGFRVLLMGTGDVYLPDGETGQGALLAFWPPDDPLADYAALLLAPVVEWGVRFAPGPAGRERRDFAEVATPGAAEARDAVTGMQDANPHWEARVVWREKARPAGEWNEEANDAEGP
jgi:hypothetical protein